MSMTACSPNSTYAEDCRAAPSAQVHEGLVQLDKMACVLAEMSRTLADRLGDVCRPAVPEAAAKDGTSPDRAARAPLALSMAEVEEHLCGTASRLGSILDRLEL